MDAKDSILYRRMAELREERGLSRSELYEALDRKIGVTSLRTFERDKKFKSARSPKMENIELLANYFGVSTDTLFSRESKNDDAVKSIKVVLGVLNNAICEANSLELVDYISEEDKKGSSKEETRMEELIKTEEFNKARKDDTEEVRQPREFKKNFKREFKKDFKKENKEVKVEKTEEKVAETVKEEVKVETKEVEDLSSKTLAELKAIAKEKGIKGYSTMKKDEILANLK